MQISKIFQVSIFAFVCGLFSFDSVKAAEWEYAGAVNPVGHTHSCYNAACPARVDTGYVNSWDHQTNAGHNCQYCGTTVTFKDNRPRPVTIFRRIAKAAVKVSTAWIPPAARVARVAWNPPAVRGWEVPPASVPVVVQSTVVVPPPVVAAPVVQYSLPTAIGGCSGAGCPTGYQPTGWYLGKNLRR